MDKKTHNEKTNRQSQTSASRKKVGSQALKTQKDYPYQKVAGKATSSSATQTPVPEAEADNRGGEEVIVGKAQDVVSQFLSKGEIKAAEYIDIIESMISDYSNYYWAESTLLGIYDFIEKEGYITEKQMEAVDNIYQSRQ